MQGQTNLHRLHSTKLFSHTWKQCPRCFSVDGRSIGRPWQFWDWVDRPIAHQQNPINQNRVCISMVLTRGPVVRELPMKQVDVAPRGLSAFSAFSMVSKAETMRSPATWQHGRRTRYRIWDICIDFVWQICSTHFFI